ncbi:MAG TPA: sensor histidine kinase [Microvirga sp.]|nr:sensor histidine kinase [Microvirga sp.]
MSGLTGLAYIGQEEKRIESLSERQAAQVVSQIDNRLEAYRAMLNVLAVDPKIIDGDIEDIRRRLEQMNMPPDIWFTIRDRKGQQILNTAVPRGERLPAFPGRGDAVIFDEGKPFTSNLIWAQVTKQWAVTLSVPVRVPPVSGEVGYALTIAVPASHLQELLADVPEGWIATINDREGKILARSFRHHEWVGQPMARRGWEITKDVPPGQGGLWRNVVTLEGTPAVGAYHRMASTGWLVGIVALPHVYAAPRRHILLLGSILALTSLLLATILAVLMGRRIIKAIQVLQVKASAMRDMKVIDFPRTSLEEVNTVAEIMRDTARDLRARHEQQMTMMQELNHRVKNTLATIQSISRMTLKNAKDMKSFEEAFSARLMALSTTHNLLTESAWSGVELHELLATELKPFQASPRATLSGRPVKLTSKVAIALGMTVHEMATNAAKYGALSSNGQLQIRWLVADDVLTFHWREKCGRDIEPPSRQGFGSRLIRQTIVHELQGTVNMVYNKDGLHAVLTIPLGVDERLMPDQDQSAGRGL